MTGMIFDIQRFSTHDGPGIRTTVFFKGCPLHCRWCHNPEGLSCTPQLQFFEEQCIGCGSCGDKTALSDALRCPTGALKQCGRVVDADTVLREIEKDRLFYADNGGVTLSGGECLLQADFAAEILRRAKTLGLHTAVDTSGCVAWSAIAQTIPFCDLYLYDIKCMDPAVHREFTGVDNTVILDNLRQLDNAGRDIWIRVPVIPGFNSNPQEMAAIADQAAALSCVKQVTLMPYHTLGASKYETLGMEYTFDSTQRITQAQMHTFREIFLRRNRNLILF